MGPATHFRSRYLERHPVPAAHRLSVGRNPVGVWQRKHMLPTVRRMDTRRRVQDDAPRDVALLRPEGWHRLGVGIPRQRFGEGAERGELTGPNPTDRGKLGTKRHVLTDGNGIPLAITLTGANVHDMHMVGKTLDAVVLRKHDGRRMPDNVCLDKGYDYEKPEQE